MAPVTSLPSAFGRVRDAVKRGHHFLTTGLWERDYTQHRGPHWLLLRELQVVMLAVRGMRETRIQLQAGSLTLITLLSVVPSLAVVFSVFEAFGGLQDVRQRLREFIYQNIAVGAQEEFTGWIDQLLGKFHGTAFGGIGFAILVFAAIRLMMAMDQAFNEVWGVRRPRPLHTRFVIYWVLLTVGPLALATSLAGTAALQGWISRRLVFPGSALLFSLAPATFTIAALVLLYLVIPNTSVRFRHALVGGVVAGVLIEVAKLGYTWVAKNLFAYNALYGSLGAIPVFIIWVNIAWLLVLLGCLVTFANQNVRTLRFEQRAGEANEAVRERVAARLAFEVALAFVEGRPPPDAGALAARTRAPVRLVQDTLQTLTEGNLVREATPTATESPGYLPAHLLEDTTLQDVVEAVRARRGVGLETTDDAVQAELEALLGEGESAEHAILRRRDLLSLARRFATAQAEGRATADRER